MLAVAVNQNTDTPSSPNQIDMFRFELRNNPLSNNSNDLIGMSQVLDVEELPPVQPVQLPPAQKTS